MPRVRFIEIATLLCAVACSGPLPSPSVIDKLRLITITAQEPDGGTPTHSDVLVGGSLEVQAVWFDGSADAGRPIYFLWRICSDGNNPDPTACLQPATGVDLGPAATGTGADTIVLTPSSFPPALPGPDPNASNYTLLLAMCPVSPPVFDTGSGQYQCPSEVSIPYAQREGIQAETTIVVRSSPPLNQNPGIAAVGINFEPANLESPVAVPTCPQSNGTPTCAGVTLMVIPTPGSAEIVDGEPESLLASFFVTDGTTSAPRAVPSAAFPDGDDGALNVVWYPPDTPGLVSVWFVLHDGRGGNAWSRTDVLVQ